MEQWLKRKDGTLPSLVLLATTSESCYSLDKPSPPSSDFAFCLAEAVR